MLRDRLTQLNRMPTLVPFAEGDDVYVAELIDNPGSYYALTLEQLNRMMRINPSFASRFRYMGKSVSQPNGFGRVSRESENRSETG